jgi:hypothetical protein
MPDQAIRWGGQDAKPIKAPKEDKDFFQGFRLSHEHRPFRGRSGGKQEPVVGLPGSHDY